MKKYLLVPIVLGGVITLTLYAQNNQPAVQKSDAVQCCKQKGKATEAVAKTIKARKQCPLTGEKKNCKMQHCPMMGGKNQAQGQGRGLGMMHAKMGKGGMGPGMMMQGRGQGMHQGMNPQMMRKMMQQMMGRGGRGMGPGMMHGKGGHQSGHDAPAKGNPHHDHKN
jgi:hypothetical protein